MIPIPILMYHALEGRCPAPGISASEQLYVVPETDFRRQTEYLVEHGFQTLTFADLIGGTVLPARPVILTFDDGHGSNAALALPILRQLQLKAEFFITTAWIDQAGYLSRAGIAELAAAGMGIGSHGHSHRFFNDLSAVELGQELLTSRAILEDITGRRVSSVSAPGGRVNDTLRALMVELDFTVLCTSRFGYLAGADGVLDCPRMVVKNTTSMSEFTRMVEYDGWYIRRQQGRYLLLGMLKRMLGNATYARIHALLSGLRR